MESKLRELVKDYLLDLKMQNNAKSTIKNYSFYLSNFIQFIEDYNLDFSILNPSQVRLFRNHIIEEGYKPRTVNKAVSAVKCFYDFLIEEDEVIGNPVNTRRLRVKEGQTLPRFMTAKELEIFKEWLTTIPENVALGFLTMLATGMRLSEVIALLCVDLIRIDNGGYVIRVRHGKGNKERYVPVMDADVAGKLIKLRQDRPGNDPLLGITARQYDYWSLKCKRQTGLDFYPHRCRHTVGTQLLQKGIALDKIQEVLGHENISTTRRYARTAPEAILELAAKADRVEETKAIYNLLICEIFSED